MLKLKITRLTLVLEYIQTTIIQKAILHQELIQPILTVTTLGVQAHLEAEDHRETVGLLGAVVVAKDHQVVVEEGNR